VFMLGGTIYANFTNGWQKRRSELFPLLNLRWDIERRMLSLSRLAAELWGTGTCKAYTEVEKVDAFLLRDLLIGIAIGEFFYVMNGRRCAPLQHHGADVPYQMETIVTIRSRQVARSHLGTILALVSMVRRHEARDCAG